MNKSTLISIIIAILTMTSCSSTKDGAQVEQQTANTVHVVGNSPSQYIPKAVIYKTNGDYNTHVMVNLTPDHKSLASYPAISDVSVNSEPISLGDGWLLDRRGGISDNSAFLQWTYSEYAALTKQPSPQEIMAKIIPGASVTILRVTPVSINEAFANPDIVKKYIH